MKYTFLHWEKWADRNKLPGINFPGVYIIAFCKNNISGTDFSWLKEIIYVGMTNAKGGLKSRLQQFDNTIKGGKGHGGAHRVRFKHSIHSELVPSLYVSACPYECNVLSNKPMDLRIMGEVAKHEYDCFAQYVESFGQLPEFNDKKRSRKK